MEKKNGLIIIIHSGLRTITNQEVLDSLPVDMLMLDREILRVGEVITLGNERNIHWQSHSRIQTKWFRSEFQEAISNYPNYQILYFGLTHIPFAMHLGNLIGDQRKVLIYQYRQSEDTWRWAKEDNEVRENKFDLKGLPNETIHGAQDAVIRIGSYVAVSPSDTKPVISNAAKEIDINILDPGPFALSSRIEVERLAEQFYKAVHVLCAKVPDLRTIHIFAAVPTGLAFLLGQHISPNKDAPAKIYHFKKNANPKYRKALTLQADGQEPVRIEDDDLAKIQNLRAGIIDQFEDKVKPKIEETIEYPESWLPLSLAKIGLPYYSSPTWNGLASISKTYLLEDVISESLNPDDQDEFYASGKWYFSDELLHALQLRIIDEPKILQAIRLFLFHEALHLETHGVTASTARKIGQFPKVVETLDYQADVYALLYEYAFFHSPTKGDFEPSKVFILSAIDLMLETMWAFDLFDNPEEIQQRRLNRYLIWQFQYCQIRYESCKGIEDVLKILSLKPDIEIKGLDASFDPEGKYILSLVSTDKSRLGIAAIVNQRLYRFGYDESIMNLKDLLNGFIRKDSRKIRGVLKSLLDTVH